ncbi:MAG: hypothetical protein ACFCUG_09360 [Thiotrichales bacterium]
MESGSTLVSRAGVTIENAVLSVRQVTELVSEMAMSSQKQGHGIEQVSHANTRLENITQQNVALVEETASATETMQQDAAQLHAAVGVFQSCSASGAPSPKPHTGSHSQVYASADRRPAPRSRAA